MIDLGKRNEESLDKYDISSFSIVQKIDRRQEPSIFFEPTAATYNS